MHPRIVHVEIQAPYRVALAFTGGSRGTVDLSPWIEGKLGVFAALRDPDFFAWVRFDREAGTIVWPNGADLDPDVLYEAAHPARAGSSSSSGNRDG